MVNDIEKEVKKLSTPSNIKSSAIKTEQLKSKIKNIVAISNSLKLISPMSSTVRPFNENSPANLSFNIAANLKGSPSNKVDAKPSIKSPEVH